ncbi:MAG TPA: bifunctional 2-polyprenyl-6-hydroxyphenol methylase/3-demethylubiquinol 3-O-methyltransferase UbiG [Dehalococcoidia bacterium]|nr:bifunctional 2-polyprenyl-6-hydroxyphenol methylase/3-demethylubiquinol 3-O-methyltransferase UbiG [Dehalococcoidia bacterium]
MSEIDNTWYDDLGEDWWDPSGPVAALHEVNPVRGAYIVGALGLGALRQDADRRRRPRVLDLGCGGGLLSGLYARAGAETLGIDPSRPSLVTASRYTASAAPKGEPSPTYLAAVGERLPFADASFDAVCAADSLEHVADLAAVLDESVRVLRPGGRFIFDTINRTWLSKVVMIWAVQNILRFAPAHTYDFEAFIRPAELRASLEARGMRWRDVRGLSFQRHPLMAGALYLTRRQAGGFRLSDDTRISYVGYAEKPAPDSA